MKWSLPFPARLYSGENRNETVSSFFLLLALCAAIQTVDVGVQERPHFREAAQPNDEPVWLVPLAAAHLLQEESDWGSEAPDLPFPRWSRAPCSDFAETPAKHLSISFTGLWGVLEASSLKGFALFWNNSPPSFWEVSVHYIKNGLCPNICGFFFGKA